MYNYWEFWEARGQWYPTWKNGTTDDIALQVDYIRVYAATVTNEKGEFFNVGGVDGRYYWQENCTFDDVKIVEEKRTLTNSDFNQCADFCFENEKVECDTFQIENGTCFLMMALLGVLPNRSLSNGTICGYLPSRFNNKSSEVDHLYYWIYVAMPCVLIIFLIVTAVLVYKYLTTVNKFANAKLLLKGDWKKFDPSKPIDEQTQNLPYEKKWEKTKRAEQRLELDKFFPL